MERPNHLNTGHQSASSRVTGLVIVIAIHVVAIAGLITALASDKIMQQLKDIQASVAQDKTPPKPPPPPPPDFVPPPQQNLIIPQFTTSVEAPPPRPVPPPPPAAAPPRAAAPPPTELHAVARTHTLPPYPAMSQRLGEQGKTEMIVNITTEGNVSECKVEKSSGSERLDTAACDYVKSKWRWQPPTSEGKPVAATTRVSVVWNLKDAQ